MTRPSATSVLTGKRLLQAVVAILALIPVSAGVAGLLFGPAGFASQPSWPTDIDSHFRFLSAIFIAIGGLFYASIPAIERKTTLFRLAALLVFAGGIGRLVSLLTVGAPSAPHLAGLGMELVVVPLLVLWQARIARAAPHTRSDSIAG
jgi:hypothetical protein